MSSESSSMHHQYRWPSLESNPHVLASLLRSLGLPNHYGFHDVYSLDPVLVDEAGGPVLAVIISYQDDAVTPRTSTTTTTTSTTTVPRPFIKQLPSLENACGTIAALHAVAWGITADDLPDTSILKDFFAPPVVSPEAMGEKLDGCDEIRCRHIFYAAQGETSQLSPDDEDRIRHHFVCFVKNEAGDLIELDGMKEGPICYKGQAQDGDLLESAARFVKEDLFPRFKDRTDTTMSIIAMSVGPHR